MVKFPEIYTCEYTNFKAAALWHAAGTSVQPLYCPLGDDNGDTYQNELESGSGVRWEA